MIRGKISTDTRTFVSFFIFGLVNNILYVVILSAAVDLVGSSTPKAVVLLADILPAFIMKLSAPFFIHLIPYETRLWTLVAFSSIGMIIISFSSTIHWIVGGILLASLSSGLGELTFLQLTHFYNEKKSIAGFSMGTGGAGLMGSFLFMLLTSILGISVPVSLVIFAAMPFVFIFAFYSLLPPMALEYTRLDIPNIDNQEMALSPTEGLTIGTRSLKAHVKRTISNIKPLLLPYMAPLCSVYISEYIINQGVSPTLLFPLDTLPHWLFSSYRDIYVVYGFLYQLGVFVSRSSVTWLRIKNLYLLSLLQLLNLFITLTQSMYQFPFSRIWLLLVLIFYEGLLGGFSYVNTFMSVSEEVEHSKREFSMGCVGVSDSLGIVCAGCINWWLEKYLCDRQVEKGQYWCRSG